MLSAEDPELPACVQNHTPMRERDTPCLRLTAFARGGPALAFAGLQCLYVTNPRWMLVAHVPLLARW